MTSQLNPPGHWSTAIEVRGTVVGFAVGNEIGGTEANELGDDHTLRRFKHTSREDRNDSNRVYGETREQASGLAGG